jgi:hypothetical protein
VLPYTAFAFGSSRATVQRNIGYCYQHLVHLAENPLDRAAAEAFERRFDTATPWNILRSKDPVGFVIARMLVPATQALCGRSLQHTARLRGARLYLAVSRSAATHGQPPATLGDLPASLIAAPPDDPFTGSPFRYETRDGSWMIYSVGDDLTDDGGDGAGFMEFRRPGPSGRTGRRSYTDLVIWGQRGPLPDPPPE